MGKPTGFMEIARQTSTELPPKNAFRTLTNFTSRCRRMNSRRRVPAAWIAAYRSAKLA